MNWATAIVLIVLIMAISGVLGRRKRSRRELEKRAQELPSQREQELESEVTELRERIQVLERIATDTNSSEAVEARRIAAEIESLKEDNKQA
ncbi:hypothetical protein ACRAQ6_13775 [Erythrobacter sp. HA6-11]